MKKLKLQYNPKTRYKNGSPRFGSKKWCEQVAANENLTAWDHQRLAHALRVTGNLKGLLMMQRLLREKSKPFNP